MMEQPGPHYETNGPLPPRRVRHPSERGKWLRAFYIGLVLLFIALTVGLMLWGLSGNVAGGTETPGLVSLEERRAGCFLSLRARVHSAAKPWAGPGRPGVSPAAQASGSV
jgi:hypothetical protein